MSKFKVGDIVRRNYGEYQDRLRRIYKVLPNGNYYLNVTDKNDGRFTNVVWDDSELILDEQSMNELILKKALGINE